MSESRGMLCLLLSRIYLPMYVLAYTKSPVWGNGSRARRVDLECSVFEARRRPGEGRTKVNMERRCLSATCRLKRGRHTEEDLRRKDLIPFVLVKEAKSPEHLPEASRLLISKAGRSLASEHNSLNPLSTSVNIARRCVRIPSPNLLLTIQVVPSNRSDIFSLTLLQRG